MTVVINVTRKSEQCHFPAAAAWNFLPCLVNGHFVVRLVVSVTLVTIRKSVDSNINN